jgi:hypothetical protein
MRSLTLFVILLAAERVHFDDHLKPQFTSHQISATSAATRGGFEQWAATERGRDEIRRFDTGEYQIIVLEDRIDSASGEAPQPGIATLLGANDRAKLKTYELVLNPEFRPAVEATVMSSGEPTTPAQVMAAAWAAEMLHIDFYSRGISLPHHSRADFQEEWREVARELGFPYLAHGDDSDNHHGPRVIFWGRR